MDQTELLQFSKAAPKHPPLLGQQAKNEAQSIKSSKSLGIFVWNHPKSSQVHKDRKARDLPFERTLVGLRRKPILMLPASWRSSDRLRIVSERNDMVRYLQSPYLDSLKAGYKDMDFSWNSSVSLLHKVH